MSQLRKKPAPDALPEAGQLALWSAGNLAGMLTQTLVVREPLFRRVMNRLVGKRRRRVLKVRRPSQKESLPLLAEAVVGSRRSEILAVFGPPRTAALGEMPTPQMTISNANVWYYPLPRNGLLAMAITFDEEHASGVEFFEMMFAGNEREMAHTD